MTGETDDADSRALGVLWGIWVGMSAAVVALGYGIETMVMEQVGETIQLFGFVAFLASSSLASSLVLSLPQRWRYASYGVVVVVAAGLLAVMWRYSPKSFELVTTMMLAMGTVACAAAVVVGSVVYFGDNGSRVEEEL